MSSKSTKKDDFTLQNFVNTQAESSQSRLEKNFRTKNHKHFMNLDECAKQIVENSQTVSDNTLPVTLEAIANLEKHPPPSEVNGIDLKALYKMLASMSAGYPVEDLEDGPTKQFLKQCYTELMDNVSDMEPKLFRDALREQEKHTKPVYSWLCNTDYSQYINLIFNDVCSSDSDDDN
ncbi:uncharacterized protein LOC116337508 isoform X2 [Contarinia nasturtii]|uniref:uncharacterized protein LOC116337508 isoform X2 n=1 Tax=Contarinia nasturtii TaxID=265458 RepID=UPI0012D3FD4B|nr:uncharacterized protein LOC116337508 isoform X2 [Contarinia nasturtii]